MKVENEYKICFSVYNLIRIENRSSTLWTWLIIRSLFHYWFLRKMFLAIPFVLFVYICMIEVQFINKKKKCFAKFMSGFHFLINRILIKSTQLKSLAAFKNRNVDHWCYLYSLLQLQRRRLTSRDVGVAGAGSLLVLK